MNKIRKTFCIIAAVMTASATIYGCADVNNRVKTINSTGSTADAEDKTIYGSGMREVKIVTVMPDTDDAEPKKETIDFDLRHLSIAEPNGKEAAYEKAEKEAEAERTEAILPVLKEEPDGSDAAGSGQPEYECMAVGEESGNTGTEVEDYGDADNGTDEASGTDDSTDDVDTGMAETAVHTDDEAETVNEGEAPETAVEPEPGYEDTSDGWVYYCNAFITHYDDCELCCSVAGNTTASGVYPTAGHTVAAGEDLPFGTQVMINGQVYVVEDRGVGPGCIDVFVDTHDLAVAMGAYYTDVYVRYPE